MKERPILFSAPMVRAILNGRKTQTRRVVKEWNPGNDPAKAVPADLEYLPDFTSYRATCPYGALGDRLWVRETWEAFFEDEVAPDRPRGPRHTMGIPAQPERKSYVYYRADGDGPVHPIYGWKATWRSPLHLPRKYSRILLEVTGARVERLQEISEADARDEGLHRTLTGQWSGGVWKHLREPSRFDDPRNAFCDLWASINGPGSWDANPWVWVVEFRRVLEASK